ncbi:hypothetical protein [Pseudomonas sp. CFBP 13719]|uniref:hypothetical protein n=1 Tax=Pseudomonas sp. CFBP 13719 TaxID=2775303 RepID=UPI0017854AF3|nr:hypothetical protein [Pseudomonas sp. CFBP 13719]MBD8684291.1 hypothetical protein [Pseudomonas sp. CFBP 13719]
MSLATLKGSGLLLMHSLQASDYASPKSWLSQPQETPAIHFDRVYQETRYWQGDTPV